MKSLYTQVKLQKDNITQTCWIDASLAKIGKVLEIKQEDNSWDNGWKVIERYSTSWMDSSERPWFGFDSAVTKQLNKGHK